MHLRFFQLLVWLALALFAPEIAAVVDSVVVDLVAVAVDLGSAGFDLVDLYSGLAGLYFDLLLILVWIFQHIKCI